MFTSTVTGYPRIGGDRELKKAVEGYWAGRLDADSLRRTARGLRAEVWTTLRDAGLDAVPSGTFSLYDQVLDAAVAVDAVPPRFAALGLSPLDTYFAMARGTAEIAPLELTKWFDTNYHYLVPELGPDTVFTARPEKAVDEYREALALGVDTRPVLLGPVTFLLLAKPAADTPDRFGTLELLDSLVDCYAGLLSALAEAGAGWVQLDEPAFTADRTEAELRALDRAYRRLAAVPGRPKLLVTGSYGELGPALDVLLATPVDGLGVDLVSGPADAARLTRHAPVAPLIVAGVVDGRNVWRTDLAAADDLLATVRAAAGRVAVGTSCSLLHVPVDLGAEPDLDPALRGRLAFARQKVDEVVTLAAGLRDGAVAPSRAARPQPPAGWHDPTVRARLAALRYGNGRAPYADRARAQAAALALPVLPTTTIGSFPQTREVRAARADLVAARIDDATYRERMRAEIASVVRLQEKLGLDVLVHGEPERNDMVQYFAEQLDGFAATARGWVQSYGSRCVRPPILYGDVTRPEPMTVEWTSYAQSLTDLPVKGMLTGPVTILAWSFVRTDQPLADTAAQVALALRDEVADLEAAGTAIIQVDEPALRELLPPRRRDHPGYLDWAVAAFRLATGGAAPATAIHTHLCYSEFGEVIDAIADLDADVTSIEASRSQMEVLADLAAAGYARGVGPGVYDIHSPRVPEVGEMVAALRAAVRAVPAERVWANPDCGLKARGYAEVEPALAALVAAARTVRAEHAG
ncbi:5-methyltetrahydropteroyltriglutamate--homocysteine S-methyltransferase [Longispora sp. NPDC051575]|uniref:5-methyltetrahydropteroyltriglutamate-- homocysteine S-methyltransferase n=1 Tax=Longispora sp. NPDC051575 TaxID=3154943 RepID=UPI003414E3B8